MRLRAAFSNPEAVPVGLFCLLLAYGAVNGLRTVGDSDLGWQMANAAHPFASREMLSYTAAGAPWVYPWLSGVLFRAAFHAGGYAAISWLSCAALVATLAIAAWRSRIAVLGLLLLGVPALSAQMIPRSGLFTVVLGAAYARLLVGQLAGQRTRLWLLPVLMVLWVNLHTGWIAGVALILGYAGAELLQQLSGDTLAHQRWKQAWPWLLAALGATLANPWGWSMYRAVALQEHVSSQQAAVILELHPLYRDFSLQSLAPLAPDGAAWWLIALSLLSLPLMLLQKRWGASLLLACACTACLFSARSEGVFLPLACLLCGPAVGDALRRLARRTFDNGSVSSGWQHSVVGGALLLVLAGVGWRCFAVVTDRATVREDQITQFGAGASWWLPQRAAAFVAAHHLPGELFSTFNLSSYLAWRLGPAYQDFADGRYLPFGDALVAEQLRLAATPLDAPTWREAAARYGIRTVLFPLARFYGVASVPLGADCASREWSPVYFDTSAIVFVRNDALRGTGLLPVHCAQEPLGAVRAKSPIGRYEQTADAAVLAYLLGNDVEASVDVAQAQAMFADDDSMWLLRGQIAAATGHPDEAEAALRTAARLHATDAAWYQLGLVYAETRRYPEAVRALERAQRLAQQPSPAVAIALAKAQLLGGDSNGALRTLAGAQHLPGNEAESRAALEEVRAAVCAQQGDWQDAIAAQEQAVAATPDSAGRWKVLAAMESATGHSAEAARAQAKAEALGTPTAGGAAR